MKRRSEASYIYTRGVLCFPRKCGAVVGSSPLRRPHPHTSHRARAGAAALPVLFLPPIRLAVLACARSIRSSPASFAFAMVPTMMMREPSMRTEKKMPTSGLAKATEAASSKPSNVAMTGKRAAPMVKEMRPSRALSGILLPSPRMFAKPLISSGPSVSREGPHCAAETKANLSSACQGSGAICPPRLSLQSRPVSASLSQSRPVSVSLACRTAGFLSMTSSASSLPIISKRTCEQ